MKINYKKKAKLLNMILLILGLSFVTQANAFLDYSEDRMADCSIEYSQKEREQKLKMHLIDQYIIIVLAPISIISTLVIIVIFLKYRQSRKQPSDIIFCISFSDLVLSIHWFISAIYAISTDSVPNNDDFFCQINSFFSCASGASQYLYNILFCIFLITRIRNSIKGFRLKKSIIHFFTIVGSLAFYLFLKLSGKTELNIYGMCSYQVDSTSWILGVSAFSIYLSLSWFTIFYFKKYVPNNSVFKKQRAEFIRFYYYYVLCISISWSILAISNVLVGLNCTYQFNPFLNIFITIGNATKLITPIILSIVRYSDPTLQECIQIHRNMTQSQAELANMSITTSMINPSSSGSEMDQSQVYKTSSTLMDNRKLSNWSHVLSANLKIMRIQSILLGLFMQDEFIDQQAKKIEKDKRQQIYKIYDNKIIDELPEEYSRQLNPKLETHKMKMKIYFPQQFKQLRQKDSKYINIKKDFDIIKNLQSLQNIAETGDGGRSGELLFFNHDNNLLMKTISHQDVLSFQRIGKQYFDYVINKNPDTLISKIYGMYSFTRKDTRDSKTYIIFMRNIANIPSINILRRYDLKGSRFDREVLIKHKIKAEELPNYTNIEEFDNQYKHNPLFKFIQDMNINDASYSTDSKSLELKKSEIVTNNQIIEEKKNNSSQVQQDSVKSQSIDSLKSSDDNNNIPNNWIGLYNQPIYQIENSSNINKSIKQNLNIAKITLKDLDFLKLEKQVYIEQKYLDSLKLILEKDSLFFKENGLIDYSLLIFKVARKDEDNTDEQKEEDQSDSNVFYSTKEKYVQYHIGIIDYLQQWNIDKLLEQKAKQAIHADLKLNVSSQNPETYQSRFKQNIIDSFF